MTGVQEEVRYCPHMVIGVQEEFSTTPLELLLENKRSRVPQVSHNFAVRTPLQQLEQTGFCWPFNNWRLTAILPMSITSTNESQNCLNPSRQQRPPLTGNRKNFEFS